jgi:hypothetical protein
MNFINKHCREAVRRRTLSGNHRPFVTYCANRPYLLLYYNNIIESGEVVLGNLACPKLPEGVMRSSLEDAKRKERFLSDLEDQKKHFKRESAADKLVGASACFCCVCCVLLGAWSDSFLVFSP